MIRYIIGVSLIAVVIMIIRVLTDGKILKRHQYALWLLIPIYMIASPFLKINVPVANELNADFLENAVIADFEEVDRTEEITSVNMQQTVPLVNVYETAVNHELTTDNQISIEQDEFTQEHKAGSNLTFASLFKTISFTVSVILVIVLLIYNAGFLIFCRRYCKFIGRDPLSGLKIYGIDQRGTPFLLFDRIYVDKESKKLNKYVICHEASHYKHKDYIWILLRYLVLAINWYNPIIWVAFILSGRDCELACDEEVLRVYGIGASTDYAKTLFNLMQQKAKAPFVFNVSTGMRDGYKTMKKRIVSIKHPSRKSQKTLVTCLATLLVFSSCAAIQPISSESSTEDTINQQTTSEVTIDKSTSDTLGSTIAGNATHIERYSTSNNVQISIDAVVDTSLPKDLSIVTMSCRGDTAKSITDNWLITNYPDANKRPQILSDFDGHIHFTDVSKDINGSQVDDIYFFQEQGFITDSVPLGMSIDANEAGKQAIDFISKYTSLRFSIYSIKAINDTANNKGYYQVRLQAEYNDLPLYPVNGSLEPLYVVVDDQTQLMIDGPHCVEFEINISSEGIMGFQGIVNLKETGSIPVDNSAPFEDIVDKCLSDMEEMSSKPTGGPGIVVTDRKYTVNKIYLAYISVIHYGETCSITFEPSWCFDCQDSRMENGQEYDMTYTYAYSAATGEYVGTIY